MRESENKKRTFIIVGLCSILMIMAVGFAVFSQQLQINSTSEVTSTWCLGFDNTKTNTYVATPGIQTGTTPTGTMTYAGSTCGTKSQVGVTLASVFKQPGDSIEYTLTILNEGSLDAAIKSILVDNTSVTSNQTITKGNVKYEINMPLSTSIAANGSTTMKVIASFQNDTDITRSFTGETSSIEVKINAEQDDGNGGFTPTPTTTSYYVIDYEGHSIGSSFDTTGLTPNTIPNDNSGFLKYVLDGTNTITEIWACNTFGILSEPVCIKGGSENGEDPSNFYGTETSGNLGILKSINDDTSLTSTCSFYSTYSICRIGYYELKAYPYGYVNSEDGWEGHFCDVSSNGVGDCGRHE